MSAREPDAVLDELGLALRRGFAREQARPPWRRRLRALLIACRRVPRRAALLAVLALLGGSTAVATHDTLWAPGLPDLPAGLREPGAVAPDRGGTRPVYVAAGAEQGVGWRLSASVCRYGDVRAVGLFLSVPRGGGGARCDVASRLPSTGVTPQAVADRRVQTYFDPVTSRTWVFGILPAGAAVAEVHSRAYPQSGGGPADARTVRTPTRGLDPAAAGHGVPADLRVFVAALQGSRDVPLVIVRDGAGAPSLICRNGRCGAPAPSTEGTVSP